MKTCLEILMLQRELSEIFFLMTEFNAEEYHQETPQVKEYFNLIKTSSKEKY